MLQVTVDLTSGRSASLSLQQSFTVLELKALAWESLGQSFSQFVTADGRILTNRMESLEAAGLQDRDWLTAVVAHAKLAATRRDFALCRCGGERVPAWGDPNSGWCSPTSAEECTADSGHRWSIYGDLRSRGGRRASSRLGHRRRRRPSIRSERCGMLNSL